MANTIERIRIELYNPAKEHIQLGQHSGVVVEGLLLCRITTSDGIEGCAGLTTYTEYDIDRSIYASACSAARAVLGMDANAREQIHQKLWRRYDFLRAQSSSLIDLALWDAAGKAANLPLHQLLGSARQRVPVYASIPTFANIDAYIDQVGQLSTQPYHAIKIHPFCELKQDLELIEALANNFNGQQTFYFDAEGQYSREAAVKIGQALSRHDCFEFFEAPMSDMDLDGHTWLRSRVNIPLVMSGIEIFSPALQTHVINQGCCDRLRFDTSLTGGVTVAKKLMAQAEAAGLPCEIQSWGFATTQAANLHMMLSSKNATGFEQAVPFEPYNWGTHDGFLMDNEGYVSANKKPGLGVEYCNEVIQPYRVESCDITAN